MRELKAEHLEALRANVRKRASAEARHQAETRQGIKTSSLSVRDFALSRWKAWNHLPARLEVLSALPEPEESGQPSISRVSPFLAWGVKWECPAAAPLPSERWDGADFRSSNASWPLGKIPAGETPNGQRMDHSDGDPGHFPIVRVSLWQQLKE